MLLATIAKQEAISTIQNEFYKNICTACSVGLVRSYFEISNGLYKEIKVWIESYGYKIESVSENKARNSKTLCISWS